MLFTSIPFAFFFVLVFILYWFVFNRKLNFQNSLLLLSSYFFYGCFDWKLTFLLLIISLANYYLAALIQSSKVKTRRKALFLSGLIINIGTLAAFKYLNFFMDAALKIFSLLGIKQDPFTLHIILPVGISFYIFLCISYLVDVYQNKMKACHNLVDTLLTFSFFPIILAGPIHRPMGLLPQIQKKREFNYSLASDGLKQILWGLFMKILIADRCAVHVNIIFTNPGSYAGSMLVIGIILFAIQIYADFAGYSNLAIGIAKLLGFKIMTNFAYPYFARDIREFWKKWNISLTNWFRDYVFLPVAYFVSRKIKTERIFGLQSELLIYVIGITITWMLTGLWHGANYTFIVWGMVHGFFLVLFHFSIKPRKKLLKILQIKNSNALLILIETGFTLGIVLFSWIFFRVENVRQGINYVSIIFSGSLFTRPHFSLLPDISTTASFIIIFLLFEWLGRKQHYALAMLGEKWPKPIRWALYYSLILAVFWFSGERQQFIYFQF